MDFSSMRPSSWNGVGAMAKVPAALAVSFVMCAFRLCWPSFRDGPQDQTSDAQLRIGESRDSGFDASHRPGMTVSARLPGVLPKSQLFSAGVAPIVRLSR